MRTFLEWTACALDFRMRSEEGYRGVCDVGNLCFRCACESFSFGFSLGYRRVCDVGHSLLQVRMTMDPLCFRPAFDFLEMGRRPKCVLFLILILICISASCLCFLEAGRRPNTVTKQAHAAVATHSQKSSIQLQHILKIPYPKLDPKLNPKVSRDARSSGGTFI